MRRHAVSRLRLRVHLKINAHRRGENDDQSQHKLAFTGEKDALIFFDATAGDAVALRVSASVDARFTDDHGCEIARGLSCTFEKAGVYRVLLAGDGAGRCTIELEHGAETLPFFMPGSGVVWNHGMLFPILLAAEGGHTVYMMNNPAFEDAVCCVKGAPSDDRVRLSDKSGAMAADWYPKLGRQWFWESAEVRSKDKWLKLDLQTGGRDTRVTLTHSGAMLLSAPSRPTKTGALMLAAENETGERLDVRFELWIGDERVYMEDVLPAGAYRRCARGCMNGLFCRTAGRWASCTATPRSRTRRSSPCKPCAPPGRTA